MMDKEDIDKNRTIVAKAVKTLLDVYLASGPSMKDFEAFERWAGKAMDISYELRDVREKIDTELAERQREIDEAVR